MFQSVKERNDFIKKSIYEDLNIQKSSEEFIWDEFFHFNHLLSLEKKLKEIKRSDNIFNIRKSLIFKTDIKQIEKIKKAILQENSVKIYSLSYFEDKIDQWHETKDSIQSLHSYLNLSWKQYQFLHSTGIVCK